MVHYLPALCRSRFCRLPPTLSPAVPSPGWRTEGITCVSPTLVVFLLKWRWAAQTQAAGWHGYLADLGSNLMIFSATILPPLFFIFPDILLVFSVLRLQFTLLTCVVFLDLSVLAPRSLSWVQGSWVWAWCSACKVARLCFLRCVACCLPTLTLICILFHLCWVWWRSAASCIWFSFLANWTHCYYQPTHFKAHLLIIYVHAKQRGSHHSSADSFPDLS